MYKRSRKGQEYDFSRLSFFFDRGEHKAQITKPSKQNITLALTTTTNRHPYQSSCIMLKFQQNRTKPEEIRIDLLYLVYS